MNRPGITVAVLAQNEAPRLEQLLPQLSWAAQVLVVDGGSTDDTAAAARRYDATVVARRFDCFAAQRNAALAAARTEWVFFIDADERPSSRMPEELRQRIASERYVGYRVPIRSSVFGRRFRFSGTQDDAPLRLVRRDAGRWSGAVHETFVAAGPIARLDAHLEHETLPNVAAFWAKMQRYTDLAAGEAEAIPSRRQLAIRPARETFRRLFWKHGWLDGPRGWLFCVLSGYSEWVLVRKQRRKLLRPAPMPIATTLAAAVYGGGPA